MEWAVAAVMSGSEDKALADLADAGFDVVNDIYCPVVSAPVEAVRGKLTEPWELAFPGYVFVRADQDAAVPCGRVIGNVSQEVVDELRRREGPGGIIRRGLSKGQRRRLRAGQQVRPSIGSLLSGLVGEVVKMDERGRVVALFDLMGRKTPTEIDSTKLSLV
jgi:hypothetical protein